MDSRLHGTGFVKKQNILEEGTEQGAVHELATCFAENNVWNWMKEKEHHLSINDSNIY